MEKKLKPVIESNKESDDVEKVLIELFRKHIYLPLLKEMNAPANSLKNSNEDLCEAIQSGRIEYFRGHFRGKFNSSISRELRKIGATWDRRQGSFSIPHDKLPYDVKNAISLSESKFTRIAQKLDEKLAQVLPEDIAEKLKVSNIFESAIFKSDQKIRQTLKDISVTPKLTKDRAEFVASQYTENMKLYIKEWTEKEIVSLREKIKESSFKGFRYESMIHEIKKSYGVSRSKAKFLARQETNLLLAKFKESRYREAGVMKYQWKCVAGSKGHEVRPMHKALEGKIFTWDNPPVVNEKGERKHPKEDYGCRCYAIPVVTFGGEK